MRYSSCNFDIFDGTFVVFHNYKQVTANMKPTVVADEMFPEGVGLYMEMEEVGGSDGLLMCLAVNEKAVHTDLSNDFEDIFAVHGLAVIVMVAFRIFV